MGGLNGWRWGTLQYHSAKPIWEKYSDSCVLQEHYKTGAQALKGHTPKQKKTNSKRQALKTPNRKLKHT